MEMNQIRYFLAVAKDLHFTRAAVACNVSQPALTRAIQKLEEEFGGPLFHRERALTQLTEESMQSRGDSCRSRGLMVGIRRTEVRIPPPE
jgi:DNA-binding transcriptional LysR family regulator